MKQCCRVGGTVSDDRTIYILTGPTGVGKTEHSIRWSEAFDAEIVSCDSLLFYRGMDIGTAKPTVAERGRVPHHLIDVVEVDEQVDVRRYVDLAEKTIAEVWARGKRVLVCGGSGFYLSAFFRPVADRVEVPENLRREVEVRLANNGLRSLVDELEVLNPGGIEGLDILNPRRVARGLERCLASGLTLEELRDAFNRQTNALIRASKRVVRLERAPDALNGRIQTRVGSMLEEGLVGEVRRLMKRGLGKNPSAVRAVGYRETVEWLSRDEPLEVLAGRIALNTRRLVKKQRSWFRNQMPLHRTITLQDGGVFPEGELFESGSAGGAMAMP